MAKNRDRLCELLEDGVLDPTTLARDLLGWLSDDECADFAQANDIGLFPDEEEEDEGDEDDEQDDEGDDE